jgi:hypothetical protein
VCIDEADVTTAVKLPRELRLGLSGFSAQEAAEIGAIVQSLRSVQSPWTVSTDTPVDALLLARGTRLKDPPNLAVLRLNLGGKAVDPRDAERRVEPLMLRKPIRAAALRIALDAAAARIERLRR